MTDKTVYHYGQPFVPEELPVIDSGGEGTVYLKEEGKKKLAVKIYHGYQHLGKTHLQPQEQWHVDRLVMLQDKLKNIPSNLPHRIVQPEALIFDESRTLVVGISMAYVDGFALDDLANMKSLRKNFSMADITNILLDLHVVISEAHKHKVILGDLTSDNFMVTKNGRFYRTMAVDFDSMQWGNFTTTGYQWDFADPLLLQETAGGVVLANPYNKWSDWYSYNAITMQLFTRLSPYEGPISPNAQAKWKSITTEAQRPLYRLSLFHPDVDYPAAAMKMNRFPTELVDYWKATVNDDYRAIFPSRLLMQLKWQTCNKCQQPYASKSCPDC